MLIVLVPLFFARILCIRSYPFCVAFHWRAITPRLVWLWCAFVRLEACFTPPSQLFCITKIILWTDGEWDGLVTMEG